MLAAGMLGIACVSLVGRSWHPAEAVKPASLAQAVSDFDSGKLTAATDMFRTLAAHGDAHAAYWYGHALDLGLGVPPDAQAAVTQYEKAWAGGVTAAGARLGALYLTGNEVPPDFAKGRRLLTEAAGRGDARAAFDLGNAMRQGIGGPVDPVGAYVWLERSALGGEAQARAVRDQVLQGLTPAQQAEAAQRAAAPIDHAAQVPVPAKAG